MFEINEDKTINITRGDIGAFTVDALNEAGEKYLFQKGDVVRIKVTEKKACENVMFQKDFVVEEETEQVEILLTEEETKIGEVISKPTDYWYEIELNPLTNPQTIIGYDEDGAKILRLYPEGNDIEPVEPTPEDIPVVDEELDITSERPVQNQAITRAMLNLQEEIERIDNDTNITSEDLEPLAVGIEENKSNIAKNKGNIEDLTGNVENLSNTLDTHTADKNNPHNVTAEQISIDGYSANNVQGAIGEVKRTLGYTVTSKNYLPNNNISHKIGTLEVTVNNNKTITLNGVGVNNPWTTVNFVGNYNTSVLEEINGLEDGVEYIFSCCPSGASGDTYQGHLFINSITEALRDNGEGVKFTHHKGNKYAIGVGVKYNYSVNNVTFQPMIRKASEDSTYEPYVEDVKTYIDDRYSHNTNNITFPFTAPHSGILNLCLTIGVGTAGVVGNMPTITTANGYIRHPYCIGYCNGWGAITFPIPMGKGDTITLAERFSGEHNAVYTERTYFTY
jgi:hypothetical protein